MAKHQHNSAEEELLVIFFRSGTGGVSCSCQPKPFKGVTGMRLSKPGAGFAHGLSRYARKQAEAVEETGLPLQKLPVGICKIITSVILQEGISHKSVLAKEVQ